MIWPWAAQAAWRVVGLPSVLPPLRLHAAGFGEDRGEKVGDGHPTPDAIDESRPSPALVIFDPAFELACAVASEAWRIGQPTLRLEGDTGTFWYRSIQPLLQSRDIPEHQLSLDGLTSHATFFVLSMLATVAGMSVSSRPMSAERSSTGPVPEPGHARLAATPLAASGSEVRSAFPDYRTLPPFATINDSDRHLVAWHFEFRAERP